MQMKHAVLCAVVLVITTASFGVSEKSHLNSNSEGDTTSQRRGSNNRAKRMSQFPEGGQGDDIYPGGRLHESLDDEMDSSIASTRTSPCYIVPADKSQSAMFFRTGRSPSSFVRIGKAQYRQDEKRQSNFIRIGKSAAQAGNPMKTFRRSSQFVRIGRDPSNYARIGAYPCDIFSDDRNDEDYVRSVRSPSHFVRIGKSDLPIDDKRGSSFVRIGKSSEADTAGMPEYSGFKESGLFGIDSDRGDRELLKRVSSFVRIGKLFDTDSDPTKRASSFVRIGKSAEEDKRASNFVRIGKSEASDENDKDKRASSFVRIGKAGLDADMAGESSKRGSSFVRIGKSSLPDSSFSLPYSLDDSSAQFVDDAPIDVANRGSSFVRIGRVPSSAFVRIGKKRDLTIDPAEYNRWLEG